MSRKPDTREILFYKEENKTELSIDQLYSDVLFKERYVSGSPHLPEYTFNTRQVKVLEYSLVKDRDHKRVSYKMDILKLTKTEDKIVLTFFHRNIYYHNNKKYPKTFRNILYITFNLKSGNVYHTTKNFFNRKWHKQIRVNQFNTDKNYKYENSNFGFKKLPLELISILMNELGLNNTKYFLLKSKFEANVIDELIKDWYCKINKINYDLNNDYFLVKHRPSKVVMKKYPSFSEALIKHYDIDCSYLYTQIFHESPPFLNLSVISQLSKFLPFNHYKALRSKYMNQIPLVRKYKIHRNSFNTEEWVIITKIINECITKNFNYLFQKLELYVKHSDVLGFRAPFDDYGELIQVVVYYNEKLHEKTLLNEYI